MPTIPTGKLERELRSLYLRFVRGLAYDDSDLATRVSRFQAASEALIAREGGKVAMLGALADFPAPKLLELSPTVGVVYDQMRQAAVQASIVAGVNSRDAARQMFQAGMDKSYRRLERFARTETTNAYWKNAFDSIKDLPMLVMLWGSEDGPKTCPWCRERDGLVIDGYDVRDHPNGRCTPIPTLRSQVEYRGSVRRDGQIFYDDAWNRMKPKWDTERFENPGKGKVSTGSVGFNYSANPSLAEAAVNSKLRGVHNKTGAYPLTNVTAKATPDEVRTFQSHVDGGQLNSRREAIADPLAPRPVGYRDADGKLVIFDGHHRTIEAWRTGVAPEIDLIDVGALAWDPDYYDPDEWVAIKRLIARNKSFQGGRPS